MNSEEYLALKEKVIYNEITVDEAWKRLQHTIKTAWTEKEWKQKRKSVIGSFCDTCGSKDNLVIQHRWHPHAMSYRHIMSTFPEVKKAEKKKVSAKEVEEITVIRECCPKCKSINIRKRMTLLTVFYCNYCHTDFMEPSHTSLYIIPGTKFRTKDIHEAIEVLNNKKMRMLYEDVFKKNENKIRTIQLLEFIEQCLAYISLEVGTKTLCKKCAYKEDVDLFINKMNYCL